MADVRSRVMVDPAALTPEQREILRKYRKGEPLTEEERKVRFPGMIAQRMKSGRGG